MSVAHAVGIDLGTTYSAVARMDETGRTAMVRNLEGELLTPSVVLFEEDETIVGREAKKARSVAPGQVAECAKRDMGSDSYSRPIGGQMIPPEVIQACILRKLRRDAVAAVGESFKCVITVPAYFDEMRRKRTQDAGEMAGLEVLDIVNEPTAAALAFGEQLGYLDQLGAPREQMNVLVYDLGGGTFDVTVIQLKPGEITTLATDGDVYLGGYDWDARLVTYAAGEFQQKFGLDPQTDESALARLRGAVEEAKHTLTARNQAAVRVEYQGQMLEVPVSRELFEELTADLMERTAYTCRQVLASAGLSWSELNRVLLVGGSSRMPMVSQMLEQHSGKRPDQSVNPDEAVARGAAIFADYLLSVRGESARQTKLQVTDVNAHSLGIEGINNETLRKENVILIRRNTPLPAVAKRKFVTKEDNQRSIVVQVLEGESVTPSHCSTIGRAVIRQLPFGLPQGTRINVHYRYASNGRLSVHAQLPGTGHEARLELEREQGLSNSGLSHWRHVVTADAGFDSFRKAIQQQRQQQEQANPAPPAALPAAPAPTVSRPISITPAAVPTLTPLTPAHQPGSQVAGPLPGVPLAAAASPLAPPAAAPLGTGTARLRPEFAAAVSEGASGAPRATMAPPLSASSSNLSDRGNTKSSRKLRGTLLGHIVASTLGLVLGYYILCIIQPSANFLKLPLPGIPASETTPSTPPPSP